MSAPAKPVLPHSPDPGGLRARKKAITRQAISDEATRLFLERGFDTVTLAEVAEAAGVSVKTIFNYFGSKEELFLDREAHLHGVILATIRDRGPDVKITEALVELCAANRVIDGDEGWAGLLNPDGYALFRRFLTVLNESPSLQARYLSSNERLQALIAAELAAERGRPVDDADIRIFSAMLVVAMHQRMSVLIESVLAQRPAEETRERVVATAAVALARVASAFPDLDRPGRSVERRA